MLGKLGKQRSPNSCHVTVPRPAAVRYNDWRQVTLPAAETFAPTLPVSVVIPYFEAPEALARTLAALEGQTYPRGLFEVVIVDDGSRPPLTRPPDTPLEVKVLRQEDRGFGLARARNTGARAASHDILVFLDSDVIAEAGLLAAHARWHHVVSDALTVGFCAYVSVAGIDAGTIRNRPGSVRDLFVDRAFDPPWMEPHMARTGNLTSKHDDLFRAVTGNNFGIRKAFYDEVGGFDESFTRYGGEDTELGYRVQTRGGLLVPVRAAFAWHQGRWAENRASKERDMDIQSAKIANLIAHPGFRRVAPGRTFAVPTHVVTVEAGDQSAGRLLDVAEDLLADPAQDLVVRIETPAGRDDDRVAWLDEQLGPDPNVRLAPDGAALDEFPASPFHVTLPAAAVFHRGLVHGLRAALGDGVTATSVLEDGSRVSIARAWALHRACRTGKTAADFGDVLTVKAAVLGPGFALGRALHIGRRVELRWRRRGVRAAVARVLAEARHVRGLRTGWRFLKWLAGALRWRLLHERGGGTSPEPMGPASAPGSPALGVEIAALGERARAVFRASSRVAHRLDGRRVDVVLADTPAEAAEAAGIDAPVVVLSEARELSVPAVDPTVHNPIGWVRNVENLVAALGPRHLLPPGVKAHRVVTPGDRSALSHCHHLEDVRGFHADVIERAGTLARLAATGVPVHLADRDPALEALLSADLHALMTADVRDADAAARESLSIRMRRAALCDHSLPSRARQICATAALRDPPLAPRVSILLATRRPRLLSAAIANVAKQRYPRLELVLALHGDGFDHVTVERLVESLVHPVKVLRLGEPHVLGSVLNAAAAEAGGALLAKMDDDDYYGADHVWDLVLAHEYSGAALVGKFPGTVYLQRLDRTVRCRVRNETWSRSITGGAMLIARQDLDRAGGWRQTRRHVDLALIDDVLRVGGDVYRTHDAGYLLVRHGDGHTWEADDDWFLTRADAARPGWHPSLADIDDAPPAP